MSNLSSDFEFARQLARFKLAVRRQLDQSVDLDRLTSDLAYARARLAEIEDAAADEELLIAVVTLRARLLSAPGSEALAPAAAPLPEPVRKGLNEYKFGARGG